jgi:hypothetical protein
MLIVSQILSQTDDSVKVVVINGDTSLVMSVDKGKSIYSDLLKGDSCCYQSGVSISKIKSLNDLVKEYVAKIATLKKKEIEATLRANLLGLTIQSHERENEIMKSTLSLSKKKTWIALGAGLGGGLLVGLIVGILVVK